MKKVLLFVFFYLTTVAARAEELKAMLNHYTTADGMASNAVSDIVTDCYGYIWLATWNGLSRYDGYDFCNYPTGKNSGLKNFHNRILTLTADTEGNIWMRMYDNRIFVLNRKTDIITNAFAGIKGGESFTTDNGMDGKTHRTASTVVKSPDGFVYAYIPSKGIFRMKSCMHGTSIQHIDTKQQAVHAMCADSNGTLWVVTEKGLTSLKPSGHILPTSVHLANNKILSVCNTMHGIIAATADGVIYNVKTSKTLFTVKGKPITSIYEDSHNNIWFTTNEQGVSMLDAKTRTVRSFTQTVPTPEAEINGATFCETGNILWVRMNKGGFGYYDQTSSTMNYFHNSPDNPWNLSNSVASFVALPEGVVWMSTIRRGLEKLSILNSSIVHSSLMSYTARYGCNETRAIIFDSLRNKVLFGNKAGDILASDIGSTFSPTPLCNVNGRIYDMTQMSDGSIYISTKGNGIFILPKGESEPRRLNVNLSSSNVYKTLEDDKGNIWIATYDGGVNMYNGQRLYTPRQMKGYPKASHHKVRSLAKGADGKIWAGTSDGILTMHCDGKDVYAHPLPMNDTPERQTGNNDIIQLVAATDGSVWVATNGGGISHTTGCDKHGRWDFETFNEADGLPSNEIKAIAISADGTVWFAADQTLCSFDTEKRLFTTFTILDGVSDIMFSEATGVALPNSILLFGTLNGYYTIDRSRLRTHNGALLKLAITDFFVNDIRMSPRLNDTYNYYIPDSGRVELPSRSSIFSVKFASLNYQLQHRVHYQYTLEGHDDEWHNATDSRTVSYSNLPAGTYKFRVKAFLLESPEKSDERCIEIVVPPYIFASAPALWTYLIIAIAAMIIYIYVSRRRKRREQEQIKRMRVLKVGPEEIAFNDDDDFNFMKSTTEWLENHFDNPNMKIEDMAAGSGLSRTSFYNQLKALTGQSPKEFVSDFRMKKAKMYLKGGNMTIAEIAYKTGFNDPVYFARLFKQRTGTTPKEYRQKSRI